MNERDSKVYRLVLFGSLVFCLGCMATQDGLQEIKPFAQKSSSPSAEPSTTAGDEDRTPSQFDSSSEHATGESTSTGQDSHVTTASFQDPVLESPQSVDSPAQGGTMPQRTTQMRATIPGQPASSKNGAHLELPKLPNGQTVADYPDHFSTMGDGPKGGVTNGYPRAVISDSRRRFLTGTEFRRPHATATELLVQLKDDNQQLRFQLKELREWKQRQLQQFARQQNIEAKFRAKTAMEIRTQEQQNQMLRQRVAELEIRAEFLLAEKIRIQKEADKALLQIESNLDRLLLNSISNSLRKGD